MYRLKIESLITEKEIQDFFDESSKATNGNVTFDEVVFEHIKELFRDWNITAPVAVSFKQETRENKPEAN